MPSHGPTEPPDEDHGWEAEYERLMLAPEGIDMTAGLFRFLDGNEDDWVQLRAGTEVEDDDTVLQAFVRMVYDAGIAHGHGNAKMEQGMVELDKELAEHDRLLGNRSWEGTGGMNMGGVTKGSLPTRRAGDQPIHEVDKDRISIDYLPGVRRAPEINPVPTVDIMGHPIRTLTSDAGADSEDD